jgi:hypothetical protein
MSTIDVRADPPTQTPGLMALPPGVSNFSNLEAGRALYTMEKSVTGCFANGSIPILLAQNDTCNPGFFCPNSNATAPPQYCPPSQECQALRASQQTCLQQGLLEPIVCPAGYYCPPGGKEHLECKKGT